MVACSFDMMFTFVYFGREGSANDFRVLLHALQTEQFSMPPQGIFNKNIVINVLQVFFYC